MMLTRLQRLRFFKMFDPLISFANGRLGVVDGADFSMVTVTKNG